MNFIAIFLVALALSMDAFAVAICIGLSMKKSNIKNSLIVALYFGIFQAFMPIIGYVFAMQFAKKIVTYSPFIAFLLLCILGGKMMIQSFKEESCNLHGSSLKPSKMMPLALATSIDALAVGVSFALIKVNIVSAALIIGIVTFVISAIGVKIGNVFGEKFKSKAEFVGGIILIAIGINILIGQ